MGFWDWLTGAPKRYAVTDDVIWMTQPAKFNGLRLTAQERLPRGDVVLVIAHFPKTLGQVKEAFGQQPLKDLSHEKRLSPEAVFSPARLEAGPFLALASSLVCDAEPTAPNDEAPIVSILVAEHHFLKACDDRIIEFAASLGRRCRITFHSSLYDPLLRQFVGPWVLNLLSKLGISATESVANPMLGRHIRKAQAQISRQVRDEGPAESAEEWLQRNEY